MRHTDIAGRSFLAVTVFCAFALNACGKTSAGGGSDATVLSIDTPAAPEWALGMVGKPLGPAVEDGASCAGYVDRVAAVYKGARAGVGLVGWGWDKLARKPIARILVADPLGAVIGAGQAGGDPRPDVVAAQPGVVTSDAVGWQATAQISSGKLKAYGLRDSGEPCLLGTFDLKR